MAMVCNSNAVDSVSQLLLTQYILSCILVTNYLIRCLKTMIYFDAVIQLIYLLSTPSFSDPVYQQKNISPGAKDNGGLGRADGFDSVFTRELIWQLMVGFSSANPLLKCYQPMMNKQVWSFPLPPPYFMYSALCEIFLSF